MGETPNIMPSHSVMDSLVLGIYREYGLASLLIVAFLVIIIILFYVLMRGLITKITEGKIKISDVFSFFGIKHKVNIDLEKHSIFAKLDTMITYQIPNIYIECPLRNKIFKRILHIRTTTLKKLIEAESKKDWEISLDEIKIIWSAFFSRFDFEWVNEAKTAGLPPVVIGKFIEHNAPIKNVLVNLIENLATVGRIYQNNKERIATIFEVIGSMETTSIFTAGEALNALNGEVSEAEFDGEKCHKCSAKKCPVNLGG